MNTTSKQQKLSRRAINTVFKLSKFVISRALYFVAGILIAIVISAAYAAVVTWPAPQVSSGNPLTAELWNTFAENLDDLNSRTAILESYPCVTGYTAMPIGNLYICLQEGAQINCSCNGAGWNLNVWARNNGGVLQSRAQTTGGSFSCDSGWVNGKNAQCTPGGALYAYAVITGNGLRGLLESGGTLVCGSSIDW